MVSFFSRASFGSYLYGTSLLMGIGSGLTDIVFLHKLGLLMADLFIRAFKCISLPLIALSLIVTFSTCSSSSGMQKIWRKSVLYTFTTTIIAASLSCLLYVLIRPSNVTQAVNSSSFDSPEIHYLKHLSELIPNNFLSPFLEHQVIGVLLMGLTIGFAVRYMSEESPRKTLISFFEGLHALLLVITRWIVKVIPLGLYGFTLTALKKLIP